MDQGDCACLCICMYLCSKHRLGRIGLEMKGCEEHYPSLAVFPFRLPSLGMYGVSGLLDVYCVEVALVVVHVVVGGWALSVASPGWSVVVSGLAAVTGMGSCSPVAVLSVTWPVPSAALEAVYFFYIVLTVLYGNKGTILPWVGCLLGFLHRLVKWPILQYL